LNNTHLRVSLLLALSACTRQEGTIGISVLADPNSDLLSQIDKIEATYTGRDKTFSATRDDDGLSLSIDLEADGSSGDLVFEGYTSDGARIAVGRVGPLPLAAIDAEVFVFLAPPNSITQAPVSLSVPRSHIGGTEASFGALLVGGLGVDGPVDAVDVYSTYLHTVQSGLSLPQPKSAISVSAGASGLFYLLGGADEADEATADTLIFDTRVPPSGGYSSLAIDNEFARKGATSAIVGEEQFLVSGDPALFLDGFRGSVQAIPGGEGLNGQAATVVSASGLQVVFAGANVIDPELGGVGAAVFELGEVRHVEAPEELRRLDHRAITLLSGDVLFIGGALEDGTLTTSAVQYSPATQSLAQGSFAVTELLATGRRNPAVAITDKFLVVVGGEDADGDAIADAEVFDVRTLAPVATIPLVVARKNATAHALGNGQILIAGGQDEAGAPTELLGLFTPDEEP
tara:strand:+ start:929 stop:2305 length:1377 start_codon:yes stop_codon:yes gene_type:complete